MPPPMALPQKTMNANTAQPGSRAKPRRTPRTETPAAVKPAAQAAAGALKCRRNARYFSQREARQEWETKNPSRSQGSETAKAAALPARPLVDRAAPNASPRTKKIAAQSRAQA